MMHGKSVSCLVAIISYLSSLSCVSGGSASLDLPHTRFSCWFPIYYTLNKHISCLNWRRCNQCLNSNTTQFQVKETVLSNWMTNDLFLPWFPPPDPRLPIFLSQSRSNHLFCLQISSLLLRSGHSEACLDTFSKYSPRWKQQELTLCLWKLRPVGNFGTTT